MTEIKIISVNCRGLGDFEKRKDVFNFLRKKNFHIYCLQDTHFIKENELRIRSEWAVIGNLVHFVRIHVESVFCLIIIFLTRYTV